MVIKFNYNINYINSIITRAVNLIHLHYYFATSYKKMNLAKICFALFIIQIRNLILHTFAYLTG